MQHTEMVTLVSRTTITGASGQALSVSPLEILSLSRFISFPPIVSMLNRSARDNSPYHMRSALCRALRSPPPSPKWAAPLSLACL